MNETEQTVDTEQALAFAQKKKEVAEALKRLRATEDWKLIIEKGYFEDWALTQIRNVGGYNQDQRRGYLEQSIARGILDDYLYAIEEEGKMASDVIPQLKEELGA